MAIERERGDDLVALTRALVDIPSPTGSEAACARYLAHWFRDRGIDAAIQDLAPERANVVARLPGRGGGPHLLLAGHLDTSYSGDPEFDYPGLGRSHPNDRLPAYELGSGVYGLGAFNMKGGLAAAALALAELAEGPRPAGDIVFAGLAGESEKAPVDGPVRARRGAAYEGRGYGARRFLDRGGTADFAIVTGPSGMRVVNAQAGSLFVELIACGRPAYLGRRSTAGGPIEAISTLVQRLAAWGADYAVRHRVDTGLGTIEPALTVGAIEGGWSFAPSTSPGVCHLFLDLRTSPAQRGAAALRELRGCLDQVARELPDVSLAARVYGRGYGSITPADHPLVRTAVDVLEQDLGIPARPFAPGSGDTSNDTNVFRRRGIPSIKVGPSDGLDPDPGSTAREGVHVSREDLIAAQRLYVIVARRLTATPQGQTGGPSA